MCFTGTQTLVLRLQGFGVNKMDNQGETPLPTYDQETDPAYPFVDFTPKCLKSAVSPNLPIYETFE